MKNSWPIEIKGQEISLRPLRFRDRVQWNRVRAENREHKRIGRARQIHLGTVRGRSRRRPHAGPGTLGRRPFDPLYLRTHDWILAKDRFGIRLVCHIALHRIADRARNAQHLPRLLDVVADTGRAPHVVDGVVVAGIVFRQLPRDLGPHIGEARQLRLVELLENAGRSSPWRLGAQTGQPQLASIGAGSSR